MNTNAMNSKGKAELRVLLAISIVAATVACIGLDLRFPELLVDPPWEQALVAATDQGQMFGRDLILTYRPLHQISTQQVLSNLFPLIAGKILTGQSWFSASLLLGMNRGPGAAIANAIMLAILISCIAWIQGRTDVLPIFPAVMGILPSLTCLPPNRIELVLLVSIASGIALATQIKLSMLPVASVSISGITIMPILHELHFRERKEFVSSLFLIAILLTTLILAWPAVKTGSLADSLTYFFGTNLEMISVYTEAMNFGSSGTKGQMEVFFYFLSLTALLVYIWRFIVRTSAKTLPSKSFLRICVEAVSVSALIIKGWMIAKASVMRHDVHMLTACFSSSRWSFLATLIGLHHNYSPKKALKPLTPSLISSTGGLFVFQDFDRGPSDRQFKYKPRIRATIEHLLTSSVRANQICLRKTKSAELKPQANDYFIPSNASKLTDDTLPWQISELIGQTLIYQTRPEAQSYASYTPQLQRFSAQYFQRGNSADPDIIKINLFEIYGRVSSGLDGKGLKQCLANYKENHRSRHGGLIVVESFVKSNVHCGKWTSLSLKTSAYLSWNKFPDEQQWQSSVIPINSKDDFIWLILDLLPRLSRRIANLAGKLLEVWVKNSDGSGNAVRNARIITTAADSLMIYPANSNALPLWLGDEKSGRGDDFLTGMNLHRHRVKGPTKSFDNSSYTLLSGIR